MIIILLLSSNIVLLKQLLKYILTITIFLYYLNFLSYFRTNIQTIQFCLNIFINVFYIYVFNPLNFKFNFFIKDLFSLITFCIPLLIVLINLFPFSLLKKLFRANHFLLTINVFLFFKFILCVYNY